MNKHAVRAIAVLIVDLSLSNSASSEVNPGSKNNQPDICGFKFAAISDLKVVVTPISPASLRNRVDNERYSACPYIVNVNYGQVAIRVDFGRDINFERLKNADQYGPVRTAFFRYDENGWGSAGEDITIRNDEISIFETLSGVTVSGVLTRENQQTRKKDYCLSVLAIGREKYANGAVCKTERTQLDKIMDVFSKKPAILADQ